VEVLFFGGFVVFVLYSVLNLGKTTAYINPRATDEQLEEAHGGLKAFWIAMGVLVLFFFLSIGGMFTTGFDMDKLQNNSSWVWDGEGSYRK